MFPMQKLQPRLKIGRLRQLGIRHYDELIHDQPKEWLLKQFSQGADEYPVNVSLLMRNLVWQMRERVIKKEKPPLQELIRTYWYMYIKPTLSRAGALSQKTDQYAQLIDTIVFMVKDWSLMEYKDIGFRDDKKTLRSVGLNANIILVAEKVGHHDFLQEMQAKYQVSTIALGGQPSLLSSEYYIDDFKKQKVNLQRSFYLYTIVDYDPSGWIIRDAFIANLRHYGIKHIQVEDLIHPDMLTPQEVQDSRYQIPTTTIMQTKNKAWLEQVHKRGYSNQKYLEEKDKKGKPILYGLESEAITDRRLETAFDNSIKGIIGKKEKLLKIMQLRRLQESLKRLILHKTT